MRYEAILVVVDQDCGWTSLLTNLAPHEVRVGNLIDQGASIGRAGEAAGSAPQNITVELRRGGEPVDIARLAG